MTDEEYIRSLPEDKQFWWRKMVAKHGTVDGVRQAMSNYTARRIHHNGGRPKKEA